MRRRTLLLGALAAAAVVIAASEMHRVHAQNPRANDVLGKWEGVLGGQLHLVVELSKLSDGSLTGTLNSVEQGAALSLSAVKVEGNKLHFEIAQVGGVYDGEFNAAFTEVNGTWTQTGAPAQPLRFHRASSGVAPSGQPAPPSPAQRPLTAPVDVIAPISPVAFSSDGKMHLVYELHVTNYSESDCWLNRVEVLAGREDKPLASYSATDLEGMVARPGQRSAAPKTKLAGGTNAVIYLWLSFEKAADVPATLRHRLGVKLGANSEEIITTTQPVPVNRKPVVVISPPLRGDLWLAANGPSNSSIHRRALIPIDGRGWIGQRFAIDWVRLFPEGGTFHGDRLDNKNYRAYGEEALAVADGVISEVKDGIPENVPGATSRAVPITLETIAGNHIVLDLGGGVFALYAHLQPGSLRVHLGDHVKRGQVLGLVGNSGNSTEPHLHFHLCDGNSPLASEGLPYAFPAFVYQGSGWGWKNTSSLDAARPHANEIPLENWVVRFPAPAN